MIEERRTIVDDEAPFLKNPFFAPPPTLRFGLEAAVIPADSAPDAERYPEAEAEAEAAEQTDSPP